MNFLIFLLFISYITAGIDLSKEIAQQRNEIELVSGILEESLQADLSSILDYIKTGYLYTALLPLSDYKICNADGNLLPGERAPPEDALSAGHKS